MYILAWIALCLFLGAIRLCMYFRVPSSFPRDIPRIPLYTIFLAIWWNLSNIEVYDRWIREPLEKHGAVILWSAGRWNVLLAHPDLVTDLLRNTATYTKAGNQVRAPHGALRTLIGDSLFNADEPNHGLYKSVMQPGLQRRFDPAPFIEKSNVLADKLIAAQKHAEHQRGVLVMPWLQKFTVDMMAVCLLGFDMQVSGKFFARTGYIAYLNPGAC